MAPQWQRWIEYAKAKVDDTVRRGNAELDRREADQAAAAADKPWIGATGDTPSLEQVRARIEHDAAQAARAGAPDGTTESASRPPGDTVAPAKEAGQDPPAGAGGPSDAEAPVAPEPAAPDPLAIDFAARQRAAEARLAAMRRELGLGEPTRDAPAHEGGPDDREPPPAPPST